MNSQPMGRLPENKKEREEMEKLYKKWVKEKGHSKASGYFDWLFGIENREERKQRMTKENIDPYTQSPFGGFPIWNITETHPVPKGCICPPTSEVTCQAADCPRKDSRTTTTASGTDGE